MKRESNIKDLLGFTQEQMAMILKISRSQYSMFELGKRDLPLHATQLLGEIITHLNASKPTYKTPEQLTKYQAPTQFLERLLLENEYQQMLLTRKIAAANKKFEAKVKVMRVVEFLNNHSTHKGERSRNMLDSMAREASKGFEEKKIVAMKSNEFKLEVLLFEQKLLEKKLRKSEEE